MNPRITIFLTAMLMALFAIPASGATDFDAPILTGVTVDKTFVDVSGGDQIVTFSISATDASDAVGYESASALLKFEKPDGSASFKSVRWNISVTGSDSAGSYDLVTATIAGDGVPGSYVYFKSNQLVLSNEDLSGTWILDSVTLTDTPGNSKTFRHAELAALGVTASIQLSGGVTAFPLLSDKDGDSFSDDYEVLKGADPLDKNSIPKSGLNILLIKAALDLKNASKESCVEPHCANSE